MSEPASSDIPFQDAQNHAGALTPEAIERLLSDFRTWLGEPGASATGGEPQFRSLTLSARQEPPDLHTLLGQMIAVRQEVNLQTKAVRTQQEQNTETLRVLEASVEELRRAPRPTPPPTDDLLRPLLKSLIDVYDALSLAYREARRVEETVLPLLDTLSISADLSKVEMPKLEPSERPFLARVLGVHGVEGKKLEEWQTKTWAAFEEILVEGAEARREGLERVKQMLASLTAGYRMGLQRIERALEQQGLEAIAEKGETFDPERMEVLEAAEGSGRPSGEVLEVVRRGYLWRGRVFRYAQVRVARS